MGFIQITLEECASTAAVGAKFRVDWTAPTKTQRERMTRKRPAHKPDLPKLLHDPEAPTQKPVGWTPTFLS